MKRYLLLLLLYYGLLSAYGEKVTVRNAIDYDLSNLFKTNRLDSGGISAQYINGGSSVFSIYFYDATQPDGKGAILYRCLNRMSSKPKYVLSEKTDDPLITYTYAGISLTIDDLRQTKQLLQYTSIVNARSCSSIKSPIFPNTTMSSVYDNLFKLSLVPVSLYGISPQCNSTYSSTQKLLIEMEYEKGVHYGFSFPEDEVIHPIGQIFFNDQHGCFHEYRENTVCNNLLNMKQITYTGKNIEVIPVAHRGVWGEDLGAGAPENSEASIIAAKTQNIPYIEVDVMSTKDNVLVCLHDYNLERLTNYGQEGYIFEKNWSEISKLKLTHRDGSVSDSEILSFSRLLDIVKRDNLILFIDIKELQARNRDGHCIVNCEYTSKEKQKESWLSILKLCYNEIEKRNMFNNIVFKTYYDFGTIASTLTEPKAKKMQYVPMLISNNFNKSISRAVSFVDQWITDAMGSVIYFETDFFNGEDVQLKPFFLKGKRYENMMDYIYNRYGLRSGIFSEEPVGTKGVTNRWAEWKMKNTTSDFRGDHLELMKYKYGNYMVITTDRVDVWKQLLTIQK